MVKTDHLCASLTARQQNHGVSIAEQRTKLKIVKSVAAIIERELTSTIKEWLKQVKLIPDLTNIPLSDSDRTGHLPKLFDDLLYRLRLPRDAQPPVSIAAATHGGLRFAQGYSASMLVEESRILQVTTFGTLHPHQSELDHNQVLLDVMIIADEADRQLTETVRGFMTAQAAAA
jgi:hypothetical protein